MQNTLKDFDYVGFLGRVGAGLLDAAIIVPFGILYLKVRSGIISSIVYEILFYAFQIFLIVKYGGTLGKLILKYRIVDEKGNFISVKSAILRYSLYFPNVIIMFLFKLREIDFKTYSMLNNLFIFIGIADILVLIFNKKKRAIHDFLAHSFVVTKESLKYMNINTEPTVTPTLTDPES